MKKPIEVNAERELLRNSIALWFFSKNDNGTVAVAHPAVFEEVDPASYQEPTIRLKLPDAQGLMDELWRVGLRPSEGTGSAGSLAATERHLKDMQTIVMHTLKINQKGAA